MPKCMQTQTGEIARLRGARFSLTKSVVICLVLLLPSSLLALVLLPSPASSQSPMLPEVSQSENYRITADVLNEGGEPGSSQNYVMSMDAIGEAIEAGESNSANYRIYSGAIYALYPPYWLYLPLIMKSAPTPYWFYLPLIMK